MTTDRATELDTHIEELVTTTFSAMRAAGQQYRMMAHLVHPPVPEDGRVHTLLMDCGTNKEEFYKAVKGAAAELGAEWLALSAEAYLTYLTNPPKRVEALILSVQSAAGKRLIVWEIVGLGPNAKLANRTDTSEALGPFAALLPTTN